SLIGRPIRVAPLKRNLVVHFGRLWFRVLGFDREAQILSAALRGFDPAREPKFRALDVDAAVVVAVLVVVRVLVVVPEQRSAVMIVVFHFHFSSVAHRRTRSSSRAHTRQGNTRSGSAWLRRSTSRSYWPSQFSSVVKPAPFLRFFTSATSGACSSPNT